MRNGTGRARTSTRSSPAPSRPRERWETARLLDARIAIRWTTSARVAHSAARRCSGTSTAWGSDGCARSRERRRWTVYDLSPGVIARARSLDGGLGARVRYLPTDLNFVRLPDAAYDVIWTTDTLHCITNLEHVVTQIEQGCDRAACSRSAATWARSGCSSTRDTSSASTRCSRPFRRGSA